MRESLKLYLIAGRCGAGKTSFVNALSRHFRDLGKTVCTFQRSKNFADHTNYAGHHFVIPPAAFADLETLASWLPAGYDVGIMEFVSYQFSGGDYTDQYISSIPQTSVNELIPSGDETPDRDTNIVWSKVDTEVSGACSFTTDRQIFRSDLLVSLDITGTWDVPTYDARVLVAGIVPMEYLNLFPNLRHISPERFADNVSNYDFGILGKGVVGIGDQIHEEVSIVCLYPPAFDPEAEELNYLHMSEAIGRSSYPDLWYDMFFVDSIQRNGRHIIINGVPPVKFFIDEILSEVI